MKKIYLYGNWKMNMNRAETETFFGDFAAQISAVPALATAMRDALEVGVFPPFTSLSVAEAALKKMDRMTAPLLGAQNVYPKSNGAFTGEVSIPMLKEAGCTHIIVGHSERRAIFGESDDLIAEKVRAVLDAELVPVCCYGETLEEREAGKTFDVVSGQLKAVLSVLPREETGKVIYAYEPVWAIGTGKSATSKEAQEICALSKNLIKEQAGSPTSILVLYGGSVKADNARELLSMDAIDGALVGGASLKANSFLDIYRAYAGI